MAALLRAIGEPDVPTDAVSGMNLEPSLVVRVSRRRHHGEKMTLR
jgi:hypothetical protein